MLSNDKLFSKLDKITLNLCDHMFLKLDNGPQLLKKAVEKAKKCKNFKDQLERYEHKIRDIVEKELNSKTQN